MYVQNNEYVSAIEAYILAIIGPPGIPLDALLSPVRAFDTYHYIPTEIIPVDTSSLIIDKRGYSFTNQGPAKVDNIDNILEDPNLLWIEDKDIDEYAPHTNIATIIRELVQVIVQQEKVINETIAASKSKTKSNKS